MDDCYLIAVNIQEQWYIMLQESNGGYALSAYETMKEAVNTFNEFKDKMFSASYESHISGSLGMITLRPHILSVPRNNPLMLNQYRIDERAYSVKGKELGVFVNFTGMKVKESILELSVIDVTSTYVNELYEPNRKN